MTFTQQKVVMIRLVITQLPPSMGAMTQQHILQPSASVLSGTTPLDAVANPPKNSPSQAIAGVPDVAEGGLPALGVHAASLDCIALGSLDGQIDVHSIEEQSGEVQKVCLPTVPFLDPYLC